MQNTTGNNLKEYTFQLIKDYKVYFISLLTLAVFAGFFEISVDYKIKEIIDTIAHDSNSEIHYLIVLFILYKFMNHGVYFIARLLDMRYNPRIIQQTVFDIYHKTVKHSLHWFDSHLAGEISNKISDFQNSISMVISHIFKLFAIVVTVLITLIFLIQVNLPSAIVLGVFILVYTPVIYFLLQKQLKLQESYVNAKQEAIGGINDSITNIFGIKVIGNVLTEFKLKLKPSVKTWRNWDRKTRCFDAFYVDNADTLMIVSMSAVQIYLLSSFYQQGELTAGGFAFVAMMTLKIHEQLNGFLDTLLFNINPSIAQVRSSYAFVNTPIDVEDKIDAKELIQVKGKIDYQNISFSYGNSNKNILQQFNLNIKAGERVGIAGASGVGKTTMMKCLLRYFDVTEGGVFVDGRDIRDVTQESLRNAISIIPQDITMFHRSIKENLLLAKHDATDEEITSACIRAKIHQSIIAMPDGYETVVGERGVKLSGGQRQRVAIARAILKNAPILILDEATSSLDTPTEKLIQDSINDVLDNSQSTVIAIAHRLSTLQHMDRIIVLDKGQIIETGTHADLIMKENGFIKNYGKCSSY